MKHPGLFVCLVACACASASPDSPAPAVAPAGASSPAAAATPEKKGDPVISIARLDVNAAQPGSATSVPLIIRVKVENRTDEPVTVDRIDVGSVGIGPYTIASTSQDFHHAVQVGHVSVFPVWVQGTPATTEDTLGGQEGTLMIRAAVYVTTPSRAQRRLTMVQKVDTSLTH